MMDKAEVTAKVSRVVKAYCLKPNQITATELLDMLRTAWGDKFQKLGASAQKIGPNVSSLIDHTRLRELATP